MLIFLLMGVPLLSYSAQQEIAPNLKDDRAKLKFLLYVNEHVPSIFNDAMNYDIDLFQTLEKQAILFDQLKDQPLYQQLQSSRPERMEIQIRPGEARVQSSALVHASAFGQWQSHVISEYRRIIGEHPLALDAKILERAKSLAQINPQGFMTGLIKTLPKERQSVLFKMPMEEKLRLLAHELPDELIGRGFLASNYGIRSTELKRESAMRILGDLIQKEGELRSLLLARLMLQDENGKIPDRAQDIEHKFKSIQPELILALQEKKNADSAIQRILTSSGSLAEKKISSVLTQGLETEIKGLKSESAKPVVAARPAKTLQLIEMAPHIGIFRGCVGGDCATQYSFPYPNSPSEHVFFVYGPDGTSKGYLAGTVVKVEGKPMFYLHTIAGARISAEETEAIIQSMYEIRKQLGVEGLVLGTDENIKRNINYDPILNTMKEYVKDQPWVEIHYMDSSLREPMQAYDKETYDNPKMNRHGRIYVPKAYSQLSLKVEAKESALAPFVDREINKGESLHIALRLSKSGREPSVARILGASGISTSVYRRIRDQLENPEGLSVHQYLDKIRGLLKGQGVDLEHWRQEHGGLFSGILKSPDAFDSVNFPHTMQLIRSGVKEAYFVNSFQSFINDSDLLTSERKLKVIHELLADHKTSSDRAVLNIIKDKWHKWRQAPEFDEIFARLARNGNIDSDLLTHFVAILADLKKYPAVLPFIRDIAEKGTSDAALAQSLDSIPVLQKNPEMISVVDQIVHRGQADREVIPVLMHLLRQDPKRAEPGIREILERGKADALLVERYLKVYPPSSGPLSALVTETLIKRHSADSQLLQLFRDEDWFNDPKTAGYLKQLASDPDTAPAIAATILKEQDHHPRNPWPHAPGTEELFDTIIQQKPSTSELSIALDRELASNLIGTYWASRPESVSHFQTLLRRGHADGPLANALAVAPYSRHSNARIWFEELLSRGQSDAELARLLGVSPWSKTPQRDVYIEKIAQRGDADKDLIHALLELKKNNSLPKLPHWMDELSGHPVPDAALLKLLNTSELKGHPQTEEWLDRVLKNSESHIEFLSAITPDYAENIPNSEWLKFPKIKEFFGRVVDQGVADDKILDFYTKNPGFLKSDEAVDAVRKIIFRGRSAQIGSWMQDSGIAKTPEGFEIAKAFISSTPSPEIVIEKILKSRDWIKHPQYPELLKAALQRDISSFQLLRILGVVRQGPGAELIIREALERPEIHAQLLSTLGQEDWKNHPILRAACGDRKVTIECLQKSEFANRSEMTYRSYPANSGNCVYKFLKQGLRK